MKKNSFTLIEVLISITIFSIVVLFLYETLDISKKSNSFYKKELVKRSEQNNVKKVLFMDLTHKEDNTTLTISTDSDQNSIVSFKSTNVYHNPFYENITYLLSNEKNLLRIESKDPFDPKKLDEVFFDSSYIDYFDSNISSFKAVDQTDKSVVFYLDKQSSQTGENNQEELRIFFRYIGEKSE